MLLCITSSLRWMVASACLTAASRDRGWTTQSSLAFRISSSEFDGELNSSIDGAIIDARPIARMPWARLWVCFVLKFSLLNFDNLKIIFHIFQENLEFTVRHCWWWRNGCLVQGQGTRNIRRRNRFGETCCEKLPRSRKYKIANYLKKLLEKYSFLKSHKQKKAKTEF